jgi:hypothetical protein
VFAQRAFRGVPLRGRAVVNGAAKGASPPFGLPSLRRSAARAADIPPSLLRSYGGQDGAPPRGGASFSVAYHAPIITACSLRQPREDARCFASLRPLSGCLPLRTLLCRRHDGSEGMTRLTLQRNGGKGREARKQRRCSWCVNTARAISTNPIAESTKYRQTPARGDVIRAPCPQPFWRTLDPEKQNPAKQGGGLLSAGADETG